MSKQMVCGLHDHKTREKNGRFYSPYMETKKNTANLLSHPKPWEKGYLFQGKYSRPKPRENNLTKPAAMLISYV
jgi:hypothetical protein